MAPNEEDLLNLALQLPKNERSNLAARLIESLDAPLDDIPSDERAAIDEAWRKEAERRLDELHAGRSKTYSWPEVRQMILGQSDDATAA
jgi:putative addiction module component (TIGR02574 family)